MDSFTLTLVWRSTWRHRQGSKAQESHWECEKLWCRVRAGRERYQSGELMEWFSEYDNYDDDDNGDDDNDGDDKYDSDDDDAPQQE